jgi:hypothetical protein
LLIAPPSAFFANLGQTSVFLLAMFNNAGRFDGSILEFAARFTVFTGFSLDEPEKASKPKIRLTV